MTRTIDHIVRTHQIARERMTVGEPVWAYTLQVTRDDDGTFEENRDRFANTLRGSAWFAHATENGSAVFSDLYCFWEEASDAESVEQFDAILSEIYDIADIDRCFISFVAP